VRIGMSDLPSNLQFEGGVSETADEHLQQRVDAIREEHQVDPDVPVDVDLRGVGVLGVAGSEPEREALLRWLLLQAAILDSPRDLAVVVLTPEAEAPRWEWTRWLPHTTTLVAGLHAARTVAAAPDDVRVVFQMIDDLIVSRRIEAERRLGYGDGNWRPHVLVVIPGEILIPRPSLSRVLSSCQEFGISIIVGAARSEQLPGECRAIVQCGAAGNDLAVTVTATGDTIPGIVGDGVPLEASLTTALSLAPVRDVSAATAAGEVPRSVLLLDLLDLPEPDAAGIRARWDAHAGSGGLGAPIGVGAAGRVSLDLRRDGPHGLAAGTTGAGKSELLQSLVASLAATHPANRLTFVLVDYKGGAAFKDCVALPHTVGFFTDLDAHLAQRALVSLNAELRRREHILSETGTKDIIDLERRDPARAPANLFIVFDEFAFLKKEVPEFVAGVIDIAQRGRSLGVHLMLATQRPQGVVDDNIRANTNLRIALRIADEVDSNDVIDRPDAAHIPKSIPGRAYVRTGHSDVQTVQSAYVGAISSGGPQRVVTKVVAFPFGSGMGPRAGGGGGPEEGDERPTDLQRLVTAIAAANDEAGIPAQPLPWLPPLASEYHLGALLAEPAATVAMSELAAPLGVIDLPAEQSQRQWTLYLGAVGHVLIYGTSGTGKSTLLRTLAASLASKLWPSDLHLYGLDFASRGLRSIASLPHCGGVVNADEIEKVERFLVMIDNLIDERKAALGAVGASSLAEYRAAHGPLLPYVVVLLDGYAGFTSVFMEVDHGALLDRVARQVAEGRAAGVHFAITADRRNAIPSSLSGVISERIVLRMADRDEYATLGLPSSIAETELPAGRGFVDDAREVQFAILGDETSGAGQAAAIDAFGAQL
ncbi:MAG: FtsK/SpoIIIE domain-containing protein, partial [Candidatus Limnocylindrales bacterium]